MISLTHINIFSTLNGMATRSAQSVDVNPVNVPHLTGSHARFAVNDHAFALKRYARNVVKAHVSVLKKRARYAESNPAYVSGRSR